MDLKTSRQFQYHLLEPLYQTLLRVSIRGSPNEVLPPRTKSPYDRPELSRFDWKPVSMLRANLSFCINLTLGASFILTFMVMVFDFFKIKRMESTG